MQSSASSAHWGLVRTKLNCCALKWPVLAQCKSPTVWKQWFILLSVPAICVDLATLYPLVPQGMQGTGSYCIVSWLLEYYYSGETRHLHLDKTEVHILLCVIVGSNTGHPHLLPARILFLLFSLWKAHINIFINCHFFLLLKATI